MIGEEEDDDDDEEDKDDEDCCSLNIEDGWDSSACSIRDGCGVGCSTFGCWGCSWTGGEPDDDGASSCPILSSRFITTLDAGRVCCGALDKPGGVERETGE